jgi:hypothetical protein
METAVASRVASQKNFLESSAAWQSKQVESASRPTRLQPLQVAIDAAAHGVQGDM